MKVCPSCGNKNLDQAKFCDGCGASLESVSPGAGPSSFSDAGKSPWMISTGEPRQPMGDLAYGGRAALRSEVTGETYFLEPGKEVFIGRGDAARGLKPDIMLTDSAALSQGVSRLHAKVVYQAGTYYLVDLNSTNSTYINGNRLVPQQFYSLRDGDLVELGKYRLFFTLT